MHGLWRERKRQADDGGDRWKIGIEISRAARRIEQGLGWQGAARNPSQSNVSNMEAAGPLAD